MKPPEPSQLEQCIAWLEQRQAPVLAWEGEGTQMPFPRYREQVDELVKTASHEYWRDYEYVSHVPSPLDADAIAGADLATVRALMTWFVRGERFCDGHWAQAIESGVALALFRRALAHLTSAAAG